MPLFMTAPILHHKLEAMCERHHQLMETERPQVYIPKQVVNARSEQANTTEPKYRKTKYPVTAVKILTSFPGRPAQRSPCKLHLPQLAPDADQINQVSKDPQAQRSPTIDSTQKSFPTYPVHPVAPGTEQFCHRPPPPLAAYAKCSWLVATFLRILSQIINGPADALPWGHTA